jgi:hypothetical protein
VSAEDIWADLQRLVGDVGGAFTAAREAAKQCAAEGHQYQLHATKAAPTRVSCKRCPKTWTIAN